MDHFAVDNFGYVYTVKNDVLVKYNFELDTFFSASLKTIYPTSIEASKSFRILLFDKERGVVKFLDNTLTPIDGDILLSDLDVFQASLVCESFNGNAFWVFDEGNMQLLKINQDLEIGVRVENLNYRFEKYGVPIYMREYNDVLYFYFQDKGVAMFDVFGTFLGFKPLDVEWVQFIDDYIVGLNSKQISFYKPPLLELDRRFAIDQESVSTFMISAGKVYLKNPNGIYFYAIKP
ncbi:MAG: hypothetical protein ACWA41_00920 [Putridiphycobacter sp.]